MMMDPLSDSPYLDPNYQASRGWPTTARQQAEAGDVHAQLYMAEMAFNSESPSIQSTRVRWTEMAADQGNLYAMVLLSDLYDRGYCVTVDLPKACDWMSKIVSMYDTAKNDVQRDAIRDVMHTYGWYLLGRKTGGAAGRCGLHESLQDTTKGLVWLERAAGLGHDDALRSLGNLYSLGNNPKVERNVEKAMELFKNGAMMGNAHSAMKLADYYRNGYVPVNPHLEKQWLRVAARLGDGKARRLLSVPDDSYEELEEISRVLLCILEEEKDLAVDVTMGESDNRCNNPPCDRSDSSMERVRMCNKCQSAKYCSRACQLAHWKKGHKAECKKLQKHKDDCKERAKENQRTCLTNLAVVTSHRCYLCKKLADGKTTLGSCPKCKVAKYCSRECQLIHWKNGGHKIACGKAEAEFMEAQDLLDRLDEQKK